MRLRLLISINGVLIVLFELAITAWTQRMPQQPLIAVGYALTGIGFALTGLAAGVPMLPVIASEERVTKQILVYTWLTVLTTLVLVPAAGVVYAAVALVAGAWFLLMAHQLYAGVRRGEPVKPLRLFLQSNNYLAVVFCALAVDSALNLPTLLHL